MRRPYSINRSIVYHHDPLSHVIEGDVVMSVFCSAARDQRPMRRSERRALRVGLWIIAAALLAALAARPALAEATIDYARDVEPILSTRCYHCHGPDEESRKKDLRLDKKEGAFRVEDGITVVKPGKPAESEMIRRITSSDPDEVMPPAEDIRKLTPKQIDTLKRWVEQGAKWGMHWAFVPPQVRTVPATQPDGWGHNPIDAYVGRRLREEKLAPAPEADRATLLRRISLDLTGLPPTPAEIDAFLADRSPDAYEKVVDRLLASPRYGERMTSDWLDVARYADTHGYQADRYRAMWPWRDWVIKAFNENLPFDQFLTWQLAGDLLPNATKEQRLATAFNRLHMQNEEGGIVDEEFRVAYVVDRVDTMGTAFLGLTFECSRCHDHKFDPITQKDFYSMFAFFQNIDESGQTAGAFSDAMPTPAMPLPDAAQDAKLAELRAQIAADEKTLSALRTEDGPAFERWLAARGAPPPYPARAIARGLYRLAGCRLLAAMLPPRPPDAVDRPKTVPGKAGRAALLSGEDGLVFPGGVGAFTRADSFSMGMWLQMPAAQPRAVVVHKSRASSDAGSRGYELLLENGHVAVGLHHMWPGNSLKVVTKQALKPNAWTHVAMTYDGSSRACGVHVYFDGTPVELNVVRDGLTRDIMYGGDEPKLEIGRRFRDSGFKGGRIDQFRLFPRALTPLEVARLAGSDAFAVAWTTPPPALSAEQRDGLFEYFLATADPAARQIRQDLASLRRSENKLIESIPEVMVMRELPQPKPAYVLKRGAYDAHGDAVTAATPAFLPTLPKNAPRNRLGLARWMVDPGNPLTARVAVNRAWQQMFGRGIVQTSDNFGTQGAQPTHPELLDWLAREFVDTMHWDTKRLLKTIALSATYRQSSKATAQLLARDPDNALLARGPSRRLTAEMIRDQALAASGLLVERLGGPPVKPYQPEGLWDLAMGQPSYIPDKGEGLHRRSLYTFWKRSIPPPAMMVFDAADKNTCTARRQTTSTPLQALTLLNDPQIVEAARFIAQRMMTEGGAAAPQRIGWAFRLVVGRRASERETAVLGRLYDEQRALFVADPAAAEKLLRVGEKPNDPKLDRADLAAGTVLGIALFNQDAAIMRR
jgi:mono/diheme cytochrome c family protein